jgi:hypothetical protein
MNVGTSLVAPARGVAGRDEPDPAGRCGPSRSSRSSPVQPAPVRHRSPSTRRPT